MKPEWPLETHATHRRLLSISADSSNAAPPASSAQGIDAAHRCEDARIPFCIRANGAGSDENAHAAAHLRTNILIDQEKQRQESSATPRSRPSLLRLDDPLNVRAAG